SESHDKGNASTMEVRAEPAPTPARGASWISVGTGSSLRYTKNSKRSVDRMRGAAKVSPVICILSMERQALDDGSAESDVRVTRFALHKLPIGSIVAS